MKPRTEIINYLIKKYGYKSYLEIGIAWKGNFDLIECEKKTGVDPGYDTDYRMSSDEFFKINKDVYDIVFIDGLHHWEQVTRDFINMTGCLKIGGIILLHDCLPTCKEHQGRKHHPIVGQTAWTGDVWKAIVQLRADGWDIKTINTDWGISIYRAITLKEKRSIDLELSWENFEKMKDKWLDIMTLEQFYSSY